MVGTHAMGSGKGWLKLLDMQNVHVYFEEGIIISYSLVKRFRLRDVMYTSSIPHP